MKKITLSALAIVAILGASANAATPSAAAKPQDPAKQECLKANPKDHKAYLSCVKEHKATAQATPAQTAPASAKAPASAQQAPSSAPTNSQK